MATGGDRFLAHAPNTGPVELVDNESNQGVIETAVTGKADFFAGELLATIDARTPHDELLVDSASQENQIGFALQVRSQRCRSRQVAELNFTRHQASDNALRPAHQSRRPDFEAIFFEQPSLPRNHHRPGALTDRGVASGQSKVFVHG
jgi:hypothetical protein